MYKDVPFVVKSMQFDILHGLIFLFRLGAPKILDPPHCLEADALTCSIGRYASLKAVILSDFVNRFGRCPELPMPRGDKSLIMALRASVKSIFFFMGIFHQMRAMERANS